MQNGYVSILFYPKVCPVLLECQNIINVFCLPILKDFDGKFIMPMDVEIDSMRYIIVYDSNTHSLLDSGKTLPFLTFYELWKPPNCIFVIGPAIDCADCLEKASRFPVQILNGGYEKFSALYPFLRTQKILYSIRVLFLIDYKLSVLLFINMFNDQNTFLNRNWRAWIPILWKSYLASFTWVIIGRPQTLKSLKIWSWMHLSTSLMNAV